MGIEPELVVCDRFRLGELRDCANGTPIIPRVSRWSEAGFDIRAVRQLAVDGPLCIEEQSRPLLAASLSVAMVRKTTTQGNTSALPRKHRIIVAAMMLPLRSCSPLASTSGRGLNPSDPGAYLGTHDRGEIKHPATTNPRRWRALRLHCSATRWLSLRQMSQGRTPGNRSYRSGPIRRRMVGCKGTCKALCRACHFDKSRADISGPDPERDKWKRCLQKFVFFR